MQSPCNFDIIFTICRLTVREGPTSAFEISMLQLLVPRAKTATRQRRALSIVGPSTWNGLPLEIRILPKNDESAFCRLLKTDLYRRGWAGGASE